MTTGSYTGDSIMIDDGKTTRIIDLTPVNELKSKLEKISSRKNWKDRSHINTMSEILQDYEKLNEDQKMYAFNHLLGEFARVWDSYLSVLENPKSVLEWKEFIDKYDPFKQYPLK